VDDDTREWQSSVPDLSGMALEEIAGHRDDSALALVLRRLEAELDDPDEPIAGFNSAL
jgi:FXSXX-COOH protein